MSQVCITKLYDILFIKLNCLYISKLHCISIKLVLSLKNAIPVFERNELVVIIYGRMTSYTFCQFEKLRTSILKTFLRRNNVSNKMFSQVRLLSIEWLLRLDIRHQKLLPLFYKSLNGLFKPLLDTGL